MRLGSLDLMRRVLRILFLLALVSASAPAQTLRPEMSTASAPPVAAAKTTIPYVDAKPILDALQASLPAELKMKTPAELEAAWSDWVSRHNAEIRVRLERGDEDSIVNLWLHGTSFTKLPPATESGMAQLGGQSSAPRIVEGRTEDLLAGIASPGANERLRFARQVLERQGIDPTTPTGKERVRLYLFEARKRALTESQGYGRALESAMLLNDASAELAAYSTIFRNRGLSSDTSLLPDFAIEQALDAMKSAGQLGAGRVRRVAIVGPGLDFTDKADGYDFYPQQTIQPFSLIDSLTRLGLARPGDLRVTTFDLSARVNHHLEAARERAGAGEAYVIHLPLNSDQPWNAGLVSYWRRFGDRIGEEVKPVRPPRTAGRVRVRAVRVRPAVVASIAEQDLNIVLERLAPLAKEEQFDLLIATNIFVYYDLFEQSLAVANVASMLRPGGLLLSNNPVFPAARMKSSAGYIKVAYSDRQYDHLFWYERQ